MSGLTAEAASRAPSRLNPPTLITPSFWPEVKQILLITLFVCTGLLGVRARAHARLLLLLLLRCLRQSSGELLLLLFLPIFLLLLGGRRRNDAAPDSTKAETISVPVTHVLLKKRSFFCHRELAKPPTAPNTHTHPCPHPSQLPPASIVKLPH